MPASHHRWIQRAIAGAVVAGALAAVGCAGSRAPRPDVPNESALRPANQALDKAVSAHAEDFAPRIIDSARRRLTVARDILFSAAEADRSMSDAEHERVQTLVGQARLDARAALIKTQAGAVDRQLRQLRDQGSGAGGAAAAASSSSDNGRRLGTPAPGSSGGIPRSPS